MTEAHPEIVIVRRRGLQEDAHHGGAWKIAFADFMTAMMAFFSSCGSSAPLTRTPRRLSRGTSIR